MFNRWNNHASIASRIATASVIGIASHSIAAAQVIVAIPIDATESELDSFGPNSSEAGPSETNPTKPDSPAADQQSSSTDGNGSATASPEGREARDDARSLSRAFRNAARAATPSVVTILSYGQQPLLPPPPPKDGEPPVQLPTPDTLTNLGSGVLIDDTGRILTNNHVIERASKVVVQLADDTQLTAVSAIGDPASDVAVVRIEAEPGVLPPTTGVGNSDAMEIGDWVLAIGSPFKLEATVSAGIISAKNRRLARIARSRLFQTDAAINPGNSGGPLVDLDGRVIGINTAIATRNGAYQGVGFAVPINQATWIAGELSTHGRVRRAAIGVTMAALNGRVSRVLKVEPGSGVLAYEIIDGSAAQAAGMRKLDVITHFAGDRVRSPIELRQQIEQMPIGSTQPIIVRRRGEEIQLAITLGSVEDPTAPPLTPSLSPPSPEVEVPSLEPPKE